MDDNTSNEPVTRDELIGELGRVNGLLDCLAALVVGHDTRAARAMAEAMRSGEIGDATHLDLGSERPKLTGWVVRHLAMMLAQHLDEIKAPNHCAWTVHFPEGDGKPARDLDLVAQWSGGVTTTDRIAKAERERDEARAALAAARHEGAEAMRDACIAACDGIEAALSVPAAIGAARAIDAIRALPVPAKVTP